VRLRPGELRQVSLAFISFLLLLCGYYILRPVRDEMGVQTGVERLQWLYSGTFVFTLLTVPAFGWLVKRVSRERLVPALYGFVVLNLLIFYTVFAAGITRLSAAAFFLWLSVVNLLVVALFWSKVSDTFSTEQSHRVYGYIAAGGTAGAIAGPSITALLARQVSTGMLLLLSAVLLAAAAACMMALQPKQSRDDPAQFRPIGGSILAGIPLTFRLANLRGVALLVICYTAVHTVLYVEMLDLAERTFPRSGDRTAFFATIDLSVNGLTLAIQLLATRWIVLQFGLRAALSLVPLVVLLGLVVLNAWRTAIPLAIVYVLHRAGEFSVVRPGREMIYTTVDPESRYKAKNFIDTTVYRANDAASSWLISAIRSAGLDAVLLIGIPVAVAWMAAGFKIGRRHDRHEPA
jgi:ATP:ADP antiporter, AAA family